MQYLIDKHSGVTLLTIRNDQNRRIKKMFLLYNPTQNQINKLKDFIKRYEEEKSQYNIHIVENYIKENFRCIEFKEENVYW